jgi:hypothetical protein
VLAIASDALIDIMERVEHRIAATKGEVVNNRWARRHVMVILLVIGVVALGFEGIGLTVRPPDRGVSPAELNPIVIENRRSGTPLDRDQEIWQGIRDRIARSDEDSSGNPRDVANSGYGIPVAGDDSRQLAPYNPGVISGYLSKASINRGEAVDLMVSTTLPSFGVQIYRMGYYGGAGSRLITSVSSLPGQNQGVPTPDPTTGLIEAHWTKSYTLQTDASWVSGVYTAHLVASDGSTQDTIFVVRADGAPADIVYQVPLTTYQAYNNWGGKSLYDYNSTGGRAYKVSFDRPYTDWGTGFFYDGDYSTIRFLEARGYNVTYVTSVDTATSPGLFAGRKVFLSNYHDEYWSKAMRDNLTAGRDQGVHLLFLSANNIYWQIRFEADSSGAPNRTVVCYKDPSLDPMSSSNPSLTTYLWREAPVNQPENALLGAMYEAQVNSTFSWVVQNASHWVYAGTGLHDGDTLPTLVGYEYDKTWANGLTPAGVVSLSNSPVVPSGGGSSLANSTIYTATSGALVFDAATFYWPRKLDANEIFNEVDSRVQQMATNLLDRMISTVPGATPTPTVTPLSTSIATNTPLPTATATNTQVPPTSTATATNTSAPPTATATAVQTSAPTSTPTSTATFSPTPSASPIATATPTDTGTPTPTPLASPSPTASSTPTQTPTATAAPTATPSATVPPPPSSIAHWTFDEASWVNDCNSPTVGDSSGNGLNGRSCLPGSGPIPGVPGKVGTAANFRGSNSYVEVLNKPLLNFAAGQDFSYSFWLKRGGSAVSSFLFAKGAGSTGQTGYSFVMSSGTTPMAELSMPREKSRLTIVGQPIQDTNWHLITATFVRTGLGKLYVDGVLQGSANISTYNVNLTNTQSLVIGCSSSGSLCFNGVLDDVGLYGHALSAAEISAIAAQGGLTVQAAEVPDDLVPSIAPDDVFNPSAVVGPVFLPGILN